MRACVEVRHVAFNRSGRAGGGGTREGGVLSRDATMASAVARALTHLKAEVAELTDRETRNPPANLTGIPDVVVLDYRSLPDAERRLRSVKRMWPMAAIMMVGASSDAGSLPWVLPQRARRATEERHALYAFDWSLCASVVQSVGLSFF
ncbi:MAG: hypothetical protein ABJE47_12800 [bacterium]